MIPPPPISTLFPYTTLFRSLPRGLGVRERGHRQHAGQEQSNAQQSHRRLLNRGVVWGSILPTPVKREDRKSTRLNSSHSQISYAVFCLKKKKDRQLAVSDI